MNTNIFPLPFSAHLIFSIFAFVIFMFQFIRVRRPYQLLMAAAVPATLLIYVNDSKAWFYGIGIAEAIFIIASLVSVFICFYPPYRSSKFDSTLEIRHEDLYS